MPKDRSVVALRQMLDYAIEARSLARGSTRADFDSQRLLNLALTRLLEIIGEAANRVPSEERIRYPGIPWPQLIGMRNRFIHGYDLVDLDLLWQTVTEDLPPLIQELGKIISPED